MTISYSSEVATSSFSCFLKLLFRWRGSIYRLLWRDFAVFAILYYLLSFLYRFILKGEAKRVFESVSVYCETYNSLIPVAFVLGFYVSLVVNRFWEQFQCIPWPFTMALFVSSLVQGNDVRGRVMRRTIMRYFSLAYVITMASISPGVRKRFPTFQHMADAGFMLPNELKIFESMKTTFNTYFVPLVWSGSLVSRARKEGRIKDDFAVKTLIDEISVYRGKCGELFNFDWVTVPLVYTQVVTLAVYMFFLSCLMGRQFLDVASDKQHVSDMYFPLFTFLQFFFYMGWLKVAESLLNPFGEDDDDFDINGLIDTNLQQAYMIVDGMHEEHPELLRDQYWDTLDIELPYTAATIQHQKPEHIGSAISLQVPASAKQFVASSMSKISEEGTNQRSLDEADKSSDQQGLSNLNSASDLGKSLGSPTNFLLPKRKGSLGQTPSRSSSRRGSAFVFARSFSQFSRQGSIVEEDMEEGKAHSPITLYPNFNEDGFEGKQRSPFLNRNDDLLFVDGSQSPPSFTTPTKLSVVNELGDPQDSHDSGRQSPGDQPQPRGPSSSSSTGDDSGSELLNRVRDRLKEIRQSPPQSRERRS